MTSAAVYDAFAVLVEEFAAAQVPPLQVAYPGIGFEPPAEGPWLEVRWFPNNSLNYGLADDAPTLRRGFGQISVCARPGAGIVGTLALTDLVVAAFAKGTRLADVRVYEKPWVSSVVEQPDRVMHPVTVPWRGFDG